MSANKIVKIVLDLSIGTTLLTSPFCRAWKYHNHEAPVANPDNTRNNNVRLLILLMPASAPVTNTISHANIRTTIVRIAVATFEFVFRIPHFARIAVIPAKKEEPIA